MRSWSTARTRGRSFIWAQPLSERRFDRRFWVISAAIHLLAFAFLRSDAFDLTGRGTGRPAASRSPLDARAVFDARDVLEVVEISLVEPESEPEIRETRPEPKPLDVDRALEALAPATPAAAVRASGAPPASGGEGGAFTPPRILGYRPPQYPDAAPRGDDPVTVVVRVFVSAEGEAVRVEVAESSGSDVLDRVAREAARNHRFAPARREGRAVAAWHPVEIVFTP